MRDELDTYLQAVADGLRAIFTDTVDGIVIGGSIVLDDFRVGMSDVDIALFLAAAPSPAQLLAMAARLDHRALPCPGKGLDLVAFDSACVQATPPVPRAVFGFVSGKRWRTALTGEEHSADYLIDLFVLRNHGRSLLGRAAREMIGLIDAATLHPQILGTIAWHRLRIHDSFHDPTGAFAVLNACRAWRFLVEGVMGSKTAGGRWAMERLENVSTIECALALRGGTRVNRLARDDVTHLLDIVEERAKEEARSV